MPKYYDKKINEQFMAESEVVNRNYPNYLITGDIPSDNWRRYNAETIEKLYSLSHFRFWNYREIFLSLLIPIDNKEWFYKNEALKVLESLIHFNDFNPSAPLGEMNNTND